MVTALLVLVWFGWTWRHPHAFLPYGGGEGQYDRIGMTALTAMNFSPRPGPGGDIVLHSATPRVATAPPGAKILLRVCVNPYGGHGNMGGDRGSLARICDKVLPVSGARLSVGRGRQVTDLVLLVRSQKPGVVVVRGIDVDYSWGWQSGHQLTGPRVRIRFGTMSVMEWVRAHPG